MLNRGKLWRRPWYLGSFCTKWKVAQVKSIFEERTAHRSDLATRRYVVRRILRSVPLLCAAVFCSTFVGCKTREIEIIDGGIEDAADHSRRITDAAKP